MRVRYVCLRARVRACTCVFVWSVFVWRKKQNLCSRFAFPCDEFLEGISKKGVYSCAGTQVCILDKNRREERNFYFDGLRSLSVRTWEEIQL